MIDKETLIKIRKKMEEYNHIDFNDDWYNYDKSLNTFQRKFVYSFIKCGFKSWQELAKVFDIPIPSNLSCIQATVINKLPRSLYELNSILGTKILENE
jgi:hypothetical protein